MARTKTVNIEWTETRWCSNTIEVEVPDHIPADQVDQWIEDNIWDFDPVDGMSVMDAKIDDEETTVEVIE